MSFMAASCICGDNMGFCMSRPVAYIAPEEIEEISKTNQNIESEIAVDKVKNKKIIKILLLGIFFHAYIIAKHIF